ncbi:hypothetical protein B0H63DRAFT_49218 [Podospora didyma]|uniref:Zinc finger PHD-type domain-containing protein n=1 Tax=Podospora didyma TaxID=330526 RepID=A0AAE0U8M8_9PEZI|nr:hypothetical protein B0H63DRAFT_49218 [Podospora didyma]
MPAAARKRALQDVDSDNTQPPKSPSMLHRIRNMWQFANLFQFIQLFGKPLKLNDDLDIEDLEAECLKPGSMVLQEIGLGFLKFLSSHRGLTHELFDEYTRRQFVSKAPDRNPFGTGETPARFADFDVFTKIRVLQQMTQFIMMSSERLREKTEEQKDMDQTNWRIEPYGWDSDDRTYFVLDDNRVYRQTDAPPPPPKPKRTPKKGRSHRASKRRRVSTAQTSDVEDAGDETPNNGPPVEAEDDDGLGGMKWECIAVTLDEVREFLSTIKGTRDDNEKVLRDQLEEHLVPILEKQEESRKRKQLQREKELLNLEKLAHAKRSSRLASKAESQKFEEQHREEERRRREDDEARRKEELQRVKMERERQSRLKSRAQRLKEREARRLQHEEELAQLSEDSRSTSAGPARMSERRRLVEIEKNKQALREIEEEEDDWIFDCACGVYGQIDDGTHSVACEKCNVWQHSKCLGIAEEEAEQDDFHFICETCRQREQAEKEAEKDARPRTLIKIKVNRPELSSSPPQKVVKEDSVQQSSEAQLIVELQSKPSSELPQLHDPGSSGSGTFDSAQGSSSAALQPPEQNGKSFNGSESNVTTAWPRLSPSAWEMTNPFSSPHPTLSPPGQSADKSRAYGTLTDRSSPAPALGQDGRAVLDDEVDEIRSRPTGSRTNLSPSKQPHQESATSTKTSPSALSTSRELAATSLSSTTSAPTILPHLTPVQSRTQAEADGRPSPLPPSHGGLSPTKQSPLVLHHQKPNGNINGVASPLGATHSSVVYPPAAAFSPSPLPQILTPPVKPAEPAMASSQQETKMSSQTLIESTSS